MAHKARNIYYLVLCRRICTSGSQPWLHWRNLPKGFRKLFCLGPTATPGDLGLIGLGWGQTLFFLKLPRGFPELRSTDCDPFFQQQEYDFVCYPGSWELPEAYSQSLFGCLGKSQPYLRWESADPPCIPGSGWLGRWGSLTLSVLCPAEFFLRLQAHPTKTIFPCFPGEGFSSPA